MLRYFLSSNLLAEAHRLRQSLLQEGAVVRENEVVVGVDDSASGQAALEWAVRYARCTYTDVRVINVANPSAAASIAWSPEFPVTAGPMGRELEAERKLAIRRLFETMSPDPDWSLEFLEGCPGPVLVTQSHDAQLLIVGTRERTGLSRFLSGSVSHYCLLHATCPVVAVHGTSRKQRHQAKTTALF